MSEEENEPDVICVKPREESGSLVLTIPKHVVDKLRLAKGSKLQIILYHSFFVLKHKKEAYGTEEPVPKTLELLDNVFELLEKERELRKRHFSEENLDVTTYNSEMKDIYHALTETNSRLFSLVKEKKRTERIPFVTSTESEQQQLDVLRELFKEYYEDTG
jgi:antitoxin component of MazEF toxin-antitoxin module